MAQSTPSHAKEPLLGAVLMVRLESVGKLVRHQLELSLQSV